MNAIHFIKSKSIWIICILSFLSAFIYNEINLKHVPHDRIRENQTIITSDDYSYLNPPENYIKTGVWKQEGAGKQSYFVRTPGYGLFYYALLKTVGKSNSLLFLKFIQLLLFSLSVYCFYYITSQLVQSKIIALIGSAIYGCTPFTIGFLYYTLTESITPALLLFFIYFLFNAYNHDKASFKHLYYLIASIVFAYLFLTRPVLGIFGLLFPFFLIRDYSKHSIKKMITSLFIFGLISVSLMTIWQIRNYRIANQCVGVHSIYYPDNNSIYRPTFKEYWSFVEGWAQEGYIAHSYMVPMWKAAISGDTSEVYIHKALETFPKEVVNYFGKKRLTNVFKKYQQATIFQKSYYDQNLPMPLKTPKIELEVINDFKQLTSEYKKEFWLQYHIISPLIVFKTMAFHSNLSLFIFQQTYRGNILMEVIRAIFFGIHSLSFIALLISFFLFKKNEAFSIGITLIVLVYVLFLCYYQRGIEERYTLPILPLLLIGLLGTLKRFQNIIISRR